jgi:hypothetical protein
VVFPLLWQLFPRSLKMLTLFVGLPAWLGFVGMIVTGSIFEHETATLTLFSVFGFVAVCQTAFTAWAAWRNDL